MYNFTDIYNYHFSPANHAIHYFTDIQEVVKIWTSFSTFILLFILHAEWLD